MFDDDKKPGDDDVAIPADAIEEVLDPADDDDEEESEPAEGLDE